jgi:hypothetical protein
MHNNIAKRTEHDTISSGAKRRAPPKAGLLVVFISVSCLLFRDCRLFVVLC